MKTDSGMPDLKMDTASLYREEIYTDRKVGTIRRLIPVKPDGTPDGGRKETYIGETQMLTPVGALPIVFEIQATSPGDAAEKFAAAAKVALDRAVKELQQLRREQASSLIIPDAGAAAALGTPGSGKIKLP